MLKKLLALIICAATLFALDSCSAGGNETDTDDPGVTEKVDGDVPVITVGEGEITLAEFCIYFRSLPLTLAANYQYYYGDQYYKQILLQQEGLDLDTPLNEQDCPNYDGTFYDYFLNVAKERFTEIAAMLNYAAENDIELEADEITSCETSTSNLVSTAKSYYGSIAEYFGDSYGMIDEDAVLSYYKKVTLARKALAAFTEDLNITDEVIEAEYEKDPNSYSYVNVMYYVVKSNDTTVKAEDVKGYADEITSAKTPEEFHAKVEDYYVNVLNADSEEKVEFNDRIENMLIAYNEGVEEFEWMFRAKLYECYEVMSEDGRSCSVFMLTKEPTLYDYVTKSVRHILLKVDSFESEEACLAEAERILGLYLADPSEDNFAKLANEYTEEAEYEYDAEGNTVEKDTKTNGGLYENIELGVTVEPFEKWAYDEARRPGDTGIIKSSYGYHVMYFIGDGKEITDGVDTIKNLIVQNGLTEYLNSIGPEFDEVFVRANLIA